MSEARKWRAKKRFLFSVFLLCVFVIFLCVFSLVYRAVQQKVVDDRAAIILNRVSEVAEEFRNALSLLNGKYRNAECTPKVVGQLKNDLWKYEFIREIGVAHNGLMTCTSSGPVNPPVQVPVPQVVTQIGSGLMFNNATLLGKGIAADVITSGDIVLFVSPMMMETMDRNVREHGLALSLIQKETGKVIRQSDALSAGNIYDKLGIKHSVYSIERCGPKGSICVRISAGLKDVTDLPIVGQVALICVGLGLGLAASYLLFFYRRRRVAMDVRLKNAIRNESFSLVYQPIVRTVTGEIVGFEALIRWRDSLLGDVSPDIFIPLAEQTGQAQTITRLVTKMALREVSDTLKRHNLFVSINVIPDDIRDIAFIDYLSESVSAVGLSPHQVVLEITERANASTEDVDKGMRVLRNRGFNIAIDDFGTGYSNISWLTSNNYDKIKIDKFITNAIGTDSINNKTLMNLIVLLREIDKDIVFEGVEHRYQVHFISREIPKAFSQGWYFYRPLDKTMAASVVASR
ncbi:EAL domain-containing protein [Mangrovibacter yixingensis]|uniref:EAL domain-containing protein n=1 Tax=Mangrovibacter yixingensis TaxID=1529639 RepID=UPI001CFB1F4C|nr:EAL domain-containing protein [Mangrovibacter yixingensis]